MPPVLPPEALPLTPPELELELEGVPAPIASPPELDEPLERELCPQAIASRTDALAKSPERPIQPRLFPSRFMSRFP